MVNQNAWFKVSLVFLLALIAKVAFSAEPAKTTTRPQVRVAATKVEKKTTTTTTKKTTTDSNTSSSGSSYESAHSSGGMPVELSVSPGLLVGSGITAFNMDINAVTRVTHDLPIYVGLDTGLMFYSAGVAPFSATFVGVPLMATGIYKFHIPTNPTIHPYAGLAMGIHLSFSSLSNRVLFEMLFRPGVSFDVAKNISLGVETRFGILESSFVFNPQVGATFAL